MTATIGIVPTQPNFGTGIISKPRYKGKGYSEAPISNSQDTSTCYSRVSISNQRSKRTGYYSARVSKETQGASFIP